MIALATSDSVSSTRSENSGNRAAAIRSPKLTLAFGPWAKTEVYVQGGLGFHSNDSRGVTTRVDPVTGLSIDADGNPIKPAKPLVQTYGAEVGVRTLVVPDLQSTVSLWWLDVESELVFAGDAGTTEASRPSRRCGVEWANFYNLTQTLTLDADFSFSHAEFRDRDPAGSHIPGSIESVVAAGITYHPVMASSPACAGAILGRVRSSETTASVPVKPSCWVPSSAIGSTRHGRFQPKSSTCSTVAITTSTTPTNRASAPATRPCRRFISILSNRSKCV